MVAIDLLDMAVLHLTLAPSRHRSPDGAGGRPDHSTSGHSVVRPAPSARPSKKRFCPPQPCATVAALSHIRVSVRIVSVPKKGGDRCARERFAISSRAQRWPPLRL